MKKFSIKGIFRAIAMSLTALALLSNLVSCNNDDSNTLEISVEELNFSADGGNIVFNIETDADAWQITSIPEWLTLSASNGSGSIAMISAIVSSRSTTGRESTLTITAGNAEKQIVVRQAASEHLYSISLPTGSSVTFAKAGGTNSINVETDANELIININSDWLSYSTTAMGKNTIAINITATENPNADARTATISVTAEESETVTINITQKGDAYANFNTSPITNCDKGSMRTATQLADVMTIGINIGNTMECPSSETAWGNPKINETFIKGIAAAGFTCVRIPCAWYNGHINKATGAINETWLARVREVVEWCISNNLYTVLNIHWDGGWLEEHCSPTDDAETINALQKALWQQIATYMRDIDDHLLFAGCNEPNVENSSQMKILLQYEQTFIDAVRETGGNNAYRTLIVQGPSTDISKTQELMKTMPTDPAGNGYLMAECHYYDPYPLTLSEKGEAWANNGKPFYFWGSFEYEAPYNATYGKKSDVTAQMMKLKTQFVNKGIPVIMGEYGTSRHTNLNGDMQKYHDASVAEWSNYVTLKMREAGIIPFWWDTGSSCTSTFNMTLIQRANGNVKDANKIMLDAIMDAIAGNEVDYSYLVN